MSSKGSGDPRFMYPATEQGVRMPPMTSAFEGQLSALPISVEPPYDDPFAPDPLQGRSTRNLVRETWPQIGTMTARPDGRMSRSILGAPARSGALVGTLIAEQGQMGAGGLLRGDLAAERVEQTTEPAPVDWTRRSQAAQRADAVWRQVESVPYPDDDAFDPDDNLPIELDMADQDTFRVQQVVDAQEVERARAQQDLLRFTRAAAEAEQVSRAALQDQNSQSRSVAVSSLLAKGSPNGAVVKTEPSAKPMMQPIFEPLHNAREIAKQLVLLEDHLAHPSRRCHDCIRKHLLTAEGLADEAVTLDETGAHRDRFRAAAQELRDIAKVFTAGGDRDRLQSRVRELRKQMSKDGFGAMEDRTPEHVNADRMGAGGSFASVQAPMPPARTAMGAVAPMLAQVTPGAVIAYRVGGNWLPGQVTGVGPGEVKIRSIVVSTYGPGTRRFGAPLSLRGSEAQLRDLVLPLNLNPISIELQGKSIRGYTVEGKTISGTPMVLGPEQLFFADLIQGVFDKVMDDPCGSVGVGSHLLSGTGCMVNVPAQLARMAVITAWYESRLNPTVSNTKHPDDSWGLFQLNRNGGLGKGYEPAALLDPVTNATILAGVLKRRINIFAPLIKREAALQPTSVGEWIGVFTRKIQLPASPDLSAQARAKTADQVFPGRPGNSLASAKPPAAPQQAALPDGGTVTRAARPEEVLAPDPTASLLQQGNALRAQGLMGRFPQEAGSILGMDEAVSKILENRAVPLDLDSENAKLIARAARAWLGVGRRTGFPPASMRAAYLYRLCADMKGYVEALRVVRTQTQGTTLATEADTLIADALRASPELALAPRPQEGPTPATTGGYTTAQKAVLGAGVLFLGAATFVALRARRNADQFVRSSQ